MEKIKHFCRAHRLFLLGVVVALACGLIAAWCGYDLGQRVNDQSVYEIVNDDYSRTVEIPAGEGAALCQAVPVTAGEPLYGVRLNMTTFNYAFAGGALRVDAVSGDETVATGTLPLLGLKDNTFATVVFSTAYTPQQDETLVLRIGCIPSEDPAEAALPLGLWVSEAQVAGMPLTATMAAQSEQTRLNATAALQFVVDYSGTWSRTLSAILGVLIFAAVLLGFALLLVPRGKQVPLPAAVLVCGLLLGVAFSVLTPPLVAPDEYTHLANCYQKASGLLGQQVFTEVDGDALLSLRECDAPYFGSQSGDIGIFAYKTYLSGLAQVGRDGTTSAVSEIPLNTGILNTSLYLGQIAGIALARAIGLGFFGMLLLGRLGNLLLYLLLAALAVHIAPKAARGVFACVALLPMSLQLAGSLSADALVLGLVFCYTALCMVLRSRKARPVELTVLLVLAAYIGPAKAIYLPVVLLVLLVPRENLDVRANPKNAKITLAPNNSNVLTVYPGTLAKLVAILLGVLFWVITNLGAALYATRDVDNVGLTRAAVAVATAAAALGWVYYKIHRNPKHRKIFLGGIMAALCVAVPVALYRLTHMWGGLTPEQLVGSIQENGDSIYTYSAGYICRNVPGTLKLILRSISAQGAQWLQQLLGTALGEPIVYPVYASWLLGVALVLVLLAAALPVAGQPAAPMGRRARLGSGFVLLCVAGLTLFVALNWTPINYTVIFGVQGRYLLPVLPLGLLLACNLRGITAQKPIASKAVFAMLCLTSFVILQGAGIYAAWQMQ